MGGMEINTSPNHFSLNLHQQNSKKILFYLMQEREGIDKTIGMSLCVKTENMLWGRYWELEKKYR